MKINKLAAIATATSIVLLAGLTETVLTNRPVFAGDNSNSTLIAAKGEVLATGNFVTVDKTTRGEAKIVEKNGRHYIELSSNFTTDSGPQVEIILHRNSRVSRSIARRDYVTLSRLKSFKGKQRYLIPNNIDLDDFESVAIWCRRFNVTFGYASL